mgnify:CR=1 FL=1
MWIWKDSGLRLWRQSDPYAVRRRTAVDYMFHTKEQQDFYETILLDKKPIVCDIRWVIGNTSRRMKITSQEFMTVSNHVG